MAWKDSVNSALSRTLNLKLVKADKLDSQKDKSTEVRALQKRIQGLEKRQRPGPDWLPKDYEPEFREIWFQARERTMTHYEKAFALYHATSYVDRYKIPGAIVECGVWRGGSMLTAALTLDRRGSHDRELYLFDTYEGMSEPTERDFHMGQERTAADLLKERSRTSSVWAIASLEDVQAGFKEINYPQDKVHFIKGKVEDTIPGEAPEQIAILRLDTDWYESTKHEFDHLYSRLVPGGVLIIDDYGTWQGSKEATHEFLDETGEPLLLIRAGRGRIAVKPGLPGVVSGS